MKKFAALMMSLLMASCTAYAASGVDYSKTENWAVLEQNVEKPVDVFYIAPTIGLPSNIDNLDIKDAEKRSKLLGTVKMVRGVYEDTGRIYSPYYRQAGLGAYYLDGKYKELLNVAADLFDPYIEEINKITQIDKWFIAKLKKQKNSSSK